jgi:Ni/Fe-hydrogenase subunit HybB-like protein
VSYFGLAGAPYTPHFFEWASTIGLFSLGLIFYWLAVTNLPVVEGEEASAH